jgi:glucokinase
MALVLNGVIVPALEIGGSHVKGAAVDLVSGRLVAQTARRRRLDPNGSAAEILGAIIACGNAVKADPGARWGVAIPGPFDYEDGVALFADVGKFDALHGVNVGHALSLALPGPPGGVTFLNDAEAFALGEWLFGVARGHRRFVGITLGTGVGSAFMLDGVALHNGPGVPPEGRADLVRIEGQPLEQFVSSRAIEASYRREGGVGARGVLDVAVRARSGDPAAKSVLSVAFNHLGKALRPLVSDFEATSVVFGGAMVGSWDLIAAPLLYGLGANGGGPLARVIVSLAARPKEAALLGAAARAEARRRQPGGTSAATSS